jgi:hypothetical protein
MYSSKRDPLDAALEKLKDRLARDSQRLRAAVEACPEGTLPQELDAALRARASAFGCPPSSSYGAFAVRG